MKKILILLTTLISTSGFAESMDCSISIVDHGKFSGNQAYHLNPERVDQILAEKGYVVQRNHAAKYTLHLNQSSGYVCGYSASGKRWGENEFASPSHASFTLREISSQKVMAEKEFNRLLPAKVAGAVSRRAFWKLVKKIPACNELSPDQNSSN